VTVLKPKTPPIPDRLVDAHAWLTRYYPCGSPSRQDWREWHELNSTVFAHIAETDKDHHHEAVALAGIARRHAEMISTEAETGPTGDVMPNTVGP
jgi:hypothetical protein